MRYITIITTVNDTDTPASLQGTLRELVLIPERADETEQYLASIAAGKVEQTVLRLLEVDDVIRRERRRV